MLSPVLFVRSYCFDSLFMQGQADLGVPGDVDPAAGVVVGAGEVGGDEEALVLGEELGLPVAADAVGGGEEAVGDGAAAGEEEGSALVLAVAGLDASAGGEPVAGVGLDGAAVAADGVAGQKALVGVG